ncbi:sporulation protein YhaL [Salsuginibacillus halophilus]|uniref:Sporulation protein YhaL n=1 Tax=Salsuginibacillus halophilus TaxID=517424 RepID=A0A2P8HG27_9BACI|nr:sporulation YhaL family protein [Salsuginibacillus halophilus]PSL45163.1 sporulation protein YhaL [Salsuginibacillus halophilus]
MDKRTKRFLGTSVVLFVLLVAFQRFTPNAFLGQPLWVYVAAAAALGSGWMWLRTRAEEQKEDSQWIEQEGRIYIRRMEAEKERRQMNER